MRTMVVVVVPPLLDDGFRFLQGVKHLCVQEFIAELAVEALVVAVLPGTTRLDISSPDTQVF